MKVPSLRLVVEVDADNIVCILIGDLNESNRIIRWTEVSITMVFRVGTDQDISSYYPSV